MPRCCGRHGVMEGGSVEGGSVVRDGSSRRLPIGSKRLGMGEDCSKRPDGESEISVGSIKQNPHTASRMLSTCRSDRWDRVRLRRRPRAVSRCSWTDTMARISGVVDRTRDGVGSRQRRHGGGASFARRGAARPSQGAGSSIDGAMRRFAVGVGREAARVPARQHAIPNGVERRRAEHRGDGGHVEVLPHGGPHAGVDGASAPRPPAGAGMDGGSTSLRSPTADPPRR
jgi:hypothetical protein